MDLQNMQKQLMDTMMLMMKNENQKEDRGSNIGTQININNMNVDMTTNKQVQGVEKRMDTPKSSCMKLRGHHRSGRRLTNLRVPGGASIRLSVLSKPYF